MIRATGPELRQKILDEAIATVRTEGVPGLTMRSLARRLGYSPATLYLYFQSKEELLTEVARVGFRELFGRLEPALGTRSPARALETGTRAYLDFAAANPEIHALMFRLGGEPADERLQFRSASPPPCAEGPRPASCAATRSV